MTGMPVSHLSPLDLRGGYNTDFMELEWIAAVCAI